MSMVHCPECGHEVSVSAVACPNCGRPLNETPPVIERKVVVPPRTMRDTGIPSWALIPVGVLVVVLLFLGYLVFRQSNEEANTNVNINVASRRTPAGSASESRTVTPPTSEPQPVVPPTTDSQTTSVPQITTVPGTRTAPVVSPADKGTAVINVRVTPPRGAAQSVRNTRFYLLDKDVEAILDEARVEPIEGNTLASS